MLQDEIIAILAKFNRGIMNEQDAANRMVATYRTHGGIMGDEYIDAAEPLEVMARIMEAIADGGCFFILLHA